MSTTTSDELEQVVEYLVNTEESIDSKVSGVKNAVKTSSFSVEDVLSEYAVECAVSGAIYPMHETEIRKIREGYMNDTGKEVESLQRICHPKTIIEDKSDVKSKAIDIYLDESKNDKKEKILELVQAAQRDGIEIKSKEVVRTLKDIDEDENVKEDNIDNEDVSEDHEDLAKEIVSEDTVEIEESNNYEVRTAEASDISEINWYVSGNKIGEGEAITHSFSHEGEYNMSVEVVGESGSKDYISKDISVIEPESINVTIKGRSEVKVGETTEYSINADVDDSIISEIDWYLNGIKSSSGETFNTAFEDGGSTYTLKVDARTTNGITDSAEKEISVITPTGVDTSIDAPNVVYKGDTETIEGTIRAINTEIETVTCKIDGEKIGVKAHRDIEVDYDFTETGEYPITLTGINNEQDSDTAVATVQCITKTIVSFDKIHDTAVHGETQVFTVDHDEELNGEWNITGAEIVSKNDSEITIKYSDESVEKAIVGYSVTNETDEKTAIQQKVELQQPYVDVRIQAPESVMENEVVEFSAEDTEVKNTSIQSVKWELGDGSYIGTGENISHKFTQANKYKVNAIVETEFGRENKTSVVVNVEPEPKVSPVIVNTVGETTQDEFEFNASKSVIENATVTEYKWEVNDEEKTGETVGFNFDAPGNYDVTLTIRTDTGISEAVTDEIHVEQFTDVSINVDGPSELIINENGEFLADINLVNTSVKGCEWLLNGEHVSDGDAFTHEFETPGHYTLQAAVKTVTGDEATSDPKQVVVDTPDSVVTAGIAITKVDGRVVTGIRTRISAEPTEVENGEIKQYKWWLNGERLNENEKFINTEFDSYGEKGIKLEVESFDGVTDSTESTVYVSPNRDKVPYEIAEEDEKADVLGKAIDVFQDKKLSDEDKNRVAKTLVVEATENGVDITESEIEDYVTDFDNVSESAVDVSGVSAIKEIEAIKEETRQEYEESDSGDGSNWEINTTEESEDDTDNDKTEGLSSDVAFGVDDDDSSSTETGETENADLMNDFESDEVKGTSGDEESTTKLESDVEFGVSDETEDSDESNDASSKTDTPKKEINKLGESEQFTEKEKPKKEPPRVLKREDTSGNWISDSYSEYVDPSGKYNFERSDTYLGIEVASDGDQSTVETPPDSTLNTDFSDLNPDHKDIGEENKEVKISPEEYDLGESVLSMPNYVQDLLDFEYIIDEEDNLAPDDANAAGIVATESGDYIAIGRVEGRDWSIHTSEKKRNIIKTYESHVLAGMDSHVQILSIPTRFDIREHIELVNDVLDENSDNADEMLMNIGRSIYPNWLENFMSQNDMKERQFYIVVTMSAQQLQEFKTSNEDIMEQLAETPVIGSMVFERFTDDSEEDIEKYQILRELNKRMGRVKSNLRRMDVEVERVTNRNEAMNVLYEYYQNMNPEKSVFPTGPITGVQDEYEMSGLDLTDIISEYKPASKANTGDSE